MFFRLLVSFHYLLYLRSPYSSFRSHSNTVIFPMVHGLLLLLGSPKYCAVSHCFNYCTELQSCLFFFFAALSVSLPLSSWREGICCCFFGSQDPAGCFAHHWHTKYVYCTLDQKKPRDS